MEIIIHLTFQETTKSFHFYCHLDLLCVRQAACLFEESLYLTAILFLILDGVPIYEGNYTLQFQTLPHLYQY